MTQNEIFTEKFLNLDHKLIHEELKIKGFFSFDKALTDNFINQIEEDVDAAGLSLNNNSVGGVYFTHGSQFFLTHMLAVSKSFFNYSTSPKVFDICNDYFNDKYRLKSLRYYNFFKIKS